uniref:Uncharacterized protein n=1 Tax=Electrophorus electricus TaxID=8005 RepID=A0AAY5ENJ6_ELEEL
MDLSTVILLALLQMSFHHAAISYDSPQDQRPGEWIFHACSEFAESSHHHQRRGTIENQKALEGKDNIKWVKSSQVPKDAYFYYDMKWKKIQYIARLGCQLCFSNGITIEFVTYSSPDFATYSNFKGDVEYLVNENNFEILEWKVTTYGAIPPLAVEFCGKMFVVKNEGRLGYIKAKGRQPKIPLPGKGTVQFTAENNNCNPVKQQAKLEKTIEKTISFQIAGSLTIGLTTEFSGKVPLIAGIKLTLSGQGAFTLSRSSSTTEKTIYSLTTEIEVPPRMHCSVKMMGINYEAKVQFTGELTRIYKNKEIRRTPVSGFYTSQEVGEIKAIVEPCQPVGTPSPCKN